eukprot:9457529-Pyramimonas_sp.AAC.1
MTKFVDRYSGGGVRGIFLEELDLWSKQLRSRCEVNGSTFRILGEAEFLSGPELIVAMLKAAYVSPDNHQRMGISTLLTSTDISNVVNKKRAEAINVCEMIRTAKKFYTDHASDLMDKSTYIRIRGDMEVRAVILAEIKVEWWNDVKAAMPPDFALVSPFGQIQPPSSGSGSVGPHMVCFGADGG